MSEVFQVALLETSGESKGELTVREMSTANES